jgi:hypothetical protein
VGQVDPVVEEAGLNKVFSTQSPKRGRKINSIQTGFSFIKDGMHHSTTRLQHHVKVPVYSWSFLLLLEAALMGHQAAET